MGVARFADYAYAERVKFDNTPEGRQLSEDKRVARRESFRKLVRFFIWSYGFGLIVAFFELPLGVPEVCLGLLIMVGLIKVYPKIEVDRVQ